MKFARAFFVGLWLTVGCGPTLAELVPAAPAAMISTYRAQHGEGRVTLDPKLNKIAHAQAAAMAEKDVLDHGVLAPFNTRVASAGYDRLAENIAYGYDDFPRTLEQWIHSAEHRKNLLMHDASLVGIASVKSAATRRSYWAMVIAVAEKRPAVPAKKPVARHPAPACRIKIIGLCL
jgi:hypothetical protein